MGLMLKSGMDRSLSPWRSKARAPAGWFDDEFNREEGVAGLLSPLDFGIMAAGETVAAKLKERPSGRLVVFGSGGIFTGKELKPAPEKLLLHTVNWLTGREDRLPREAEVPWSYPRVQLNEREMFLWRSLTLVGLPLLAVYCGIVAVMIRKAA